MSIKKYVFKIIIIGSYGVGKTSILNAHISQRFNLDYKPTIGANILKKEMILPEKNAHVIFNFWDIAGQTLFKNLRKSFFQGSDAVMLVYDCTRRETFESLEDWYQSVKKYTKKYKVGLLVCNKIDLENRIITEEEGRNKIKELKLKNFNYIETSALTTQNVGAAFDHIANTLIK
ncbi:MAG: Rab family GTPase [Candidatus Helarchaeota archaeon]